MDDELTPPLDGKPLRPNHPLYDERKRAALDKRTASIDRHVGVAEEVTWRAARDYIFIRDNKLFIQDGYSSMYEWVEKKRGRNPDTVAKHMAVAGNFTLSEVQKHGTEKLFEILKYVALTVTDEGQDWSLKTLRLAVPSGRGAIEHRHAKDSSVRDVKRAIAHQRELATRRLAEHASDEDRAFVERITKAMVVDESGRMLAEVKHTPSSSGKSEDDLVRLAVRRGDLHELALRLAHAFDPAPKRGRT